MKKIFVFLMSLMLLCTTIPVNAQENNEDGILITSNKISDNDEPYTLEDGTTVYTLSALNRSIDQKLRLPISRYLTLTSQREDLDLSKITAEMDTESDNGLGKKDIKLKFVSRAADKAELEVNFANANVTTQLNQNAGILIKSEEGTLLKRIAFAYSTPALTDEHDGSEFHSMSAWSGSARYDFDYGIEYKVSGLVDVYQTSANLSYTYKSLGTFGLKYFMLDKDGDFTFTNGSIKIKAKNGNPGQKNTITLKCKSSYLKSLKKKLIHDYCVKDEDGDYGPATQTVIFNDVALEYKNVQGDIYENGIGDNGQGCTIGGSEDPINLAHYATLSPQKIVPVKSYKKTRTTVTLKWKKTSDSVSGYAIYRSKKKSSGYKKIKTVSSKTTSYKNTKLKKNTNYYYKIRPYRNIKYTYTTKSKKKKTITRIAYGKYSSAKKIKTSK